MKIIDNDIIPFKGFAAINIFGAIFVRRGVSISDRLLRHEMIHSKQMRELSAIVFYAWYLIEWLIRLLVYWNAVKSYRNISFEREAYANEGNLLYLKERRPFAFLKYIFKKNDAVL